MNGTICRPLLCVGLACALLGCAEKASDAEIEEMCARLAVLRNKPKDEAMKASCITEARAEGISRRQARCRVAAVNTQEYWNRCRTGEKRQ